MNADDARVLYSTQLPGVDRSVCELDQWIAIIMIVITGSHPPIERCVLLKSSSRTIHTSSISMGECLRGTINQHICLSINRYVGGLVIAFCLFDGICVVFPWIRFRVLSFCFLFCR